jgi:hypothetical protein
MIDSFGIVSGIRREWEILFFRIHQFMTSTDLDLPEASREEL